MDSLNFTSSKNWKCARFRRALEIQTIFYPVLNFDYTAQIARDWNTKDPVSGFAGFVTRFEIDDEYAARFPVQTVGTCGRHNELWVLAEDLAEFNAHIIGQIEVVARFYGEEFEGERK